MHTTPWPISALIKNHYGAKLSGWRAAQGDEELDNMGMADCLLRGDAFLTLGDFQRARGYYHKVNLLSWDTANYYDKMQAAVGGLVCQENVSAAPTLDYITAETAAAEKATALVVKMIARKKKTLMNDGADNYKSRILKSFSAAAPHIQEIYATGSNAYYHQALSLLWLQAHQNYHLQDKPAFKRKCQQFKYLIRYMRNFEVKELYKPVVVRLNIMTNE